jgi:bifunctional non-homologous end joining protein LigD
LTAACGAKAEGIISKRLDPRYVPGDRGLWCKTKCYEREEFIIVGYSEPEGSRHCLGALLLAYHDDAGRLVYAGRVGTGMSGANCAACMKRSSRFAPRRCPSTCAADYGPLRIPAQSLSSCLGSA